MVFLKITHLPVNETGLYVFNTVLFCLSAVLMIWLIHLVYKGQKYKDFLCLVAGLFYISAPELLHGMGIVYWHQSLFQVTLLLQIILFYKYADGNSHWAKYMFYAFALINPYIEWTGYVANVGFAMAELIRYWGVNKRKGFLKALILGILTGRSFGLFSFHYLLRVDTAAFVTALKDRFMARNITSGNALTDVFGSYFESFLYIWLALAVLLVYCFVKYQKLELKHGILFLVLAFPVAENIIMKQHALYYPYDRMKAVFVVILLLCEVVRNMIEKRDIQKTRCLVLFVTGCALVLNVTSYVRNESYIWEVDYRKDNEMLADYVLDKYPDAVYASDTAIRGYMNLLFGRGIYEWADVDGAKELAVEKGKEDIVFIEKEGYKLTNISVYHRNTPDVERYHAVDHTVQCSVPVGTV